MRTQIGRRDLAFWDGEKDKLVDLYTSGYSHAKIAEQYGVSTETIQRAMLYLGQRARTPAERTGPMTPHYKDGKQCGRVITARVPRERCETCGAARDLHVHHIDGDRMNNDPLNWQVLCRSCHSRLHRKRYWSERKKEVQLPEYSESLP